MSLHNYENSIFEGLANGNWRLQFRIASTYRGSPIVHLKQENVVYPDTAEYRFDAWFVEMPINIKKGPVTGIDYRAKFIMRVYVDEFPLVTSFNIGDELVRVDNGYRYKITEMSPMERWTKIRRFTLEEAP